MTDEELRSYGISPDSPRAIPAGKSVTEGGDFKTVERVANALEDEGKVHVWRYCNEIFDSYFIANSHVLEAPKVSDKIPVVLPTPIIPGTPRIPPPQPVQ